MMNRYPAILATCFFALLLSACSGGGGSNLDADASSASGIDLGNVGAAPGVVLAAGDPVFETPVDVLDEKLLCTPFENPDKNPVLLIHGTFTAGQEQYEWNYIPYLRGLGFDVCITTYPDRGFGDMQISAEYVVYAVLKIHQETGRQVDMAGHSQGASMPRWAIRWWPSVQAALDDFVMHAGPNHGTIIADQGAQGAKPAAFWQFQTTSNFVARVNADDETPGDVDYTSIYTTTDELVQPAPLPLIGGEATAELEPGSNNPNLANIWLQEICPAVVVDHVTIGTTDGLTAVLTVDAFLNDGPADFDRAGGLAICATPPIADTSPASFQAAGADSFSSPPTFESVDEEPPIKPYAQP